MPSIHVPLSDNDFAALRAAARERGKTMAAVVRLALAAYLAPPAAPAHAPTSHDGAPATAPTAAEVGALELEVLRAEQRLLAAREAARIDRALEPPHPHPQPYIDRRTISQSTHEWIKRQIIAYDAALEVLRAEQRLLAAREAARIDRARQIAAHDAAQEGE